MDVRLPKNVAQAIYDYLGNRPYKEVYTVMDTLLNAPDIVPDAPVQEQPGVCESAPGEGSGTGSEVGSESEE